MLQEEILKSFQRSNFVSTICQSIEGGNRQKVLQQGGKLADDFLLNVTKTLKFSPMKTCTFAYALAQSQYKSVVQDSIRILKSKLPEVTDTEDIPEDLLHSLLNFILSTEVSI